MKSHTDISGEAVSGALILTPCFNRLQKSSSICTPGYGDAPEHGQRGNETLLSLLFAATQFYRHYFIHCVSFDFCPHEKIKSVYLFFVFFVFLPSENISQRRTPKDHTSLWLVYTLSNILSGAIHFKGRRAWKDIDTRQILQESHINRNGSCLQTRSLCCWLWKKDLWCVPTEQSNKRWIVNSIVSMKVPYIAFPDVVGVFVYVSGQAKVADLDNVVLWQENVPGRQISVDTLWIHTGSDIHHYPADRCVSMLVFVFA